MSAQSDLFAPALPVVCPDAQKPALPLSAARAAALAWLREAAETVQAVYPGVNWNTAVPAEIDDAFQEAWHAYWIAGTITKDEMLAAWRRWYGACL